MADSATPQPALARHYFTYMVGVFFQKIAGFALIPVYTAWLATADYGAVELLSTFVGLTALFVALGVPGALNKCYHRDCRTDTERAQLVGTSVLFTVPVAVLLIVAAFFLDHTIAETVFERPEWAPYVRLSIISLALMQTSTLPMELMRTLGLAGRYVRFSILQMAVQAALTILFLVYFHLGVGAVLYGNIAGFAAIQIGTLGFLWQHSRFQFSWEQFRPLAAFGLLLAPVSACAWVVNVSDRFFLQRLTTDAEVGLYALGYKFGWLVELALVMPFQKAWNPYFFSVADREDAPAVLAKVLTYYVLLIGFGACVISACGAPAIRLMTRAEYHAAARVIPLIALSYGLSGLVMCLSTGLIVIRQTRMVTLVALVGALVNVLLNVALIPGHGMMGAAVATVLTFVITSVLTACATARWYPVPIETGRLLKVVFSVVLFYALAMGIRFETAQIELAARATALLALPFFLLLVGFFSDEEMHWLKSQLSWATANGAVWAGRLAAMRSVSPWGKGPQ
ncbi:MAG: lipopolysaccharide biosynthesis protein [Candidatus Binatia bacterium]